MLEAARRFDESRLDKENPKIHDILLFLVKTGLRMDEMRFLEWSDVSFEDRLINIREKKVVETRVVPLAEDAVLRLTKQLAGKTSKSPVFKDAADIKKFGMRLKIREPGELLALRASDVDLANRRIVTTRTLRWKPKGTNGVVPMCDIVHDLLKGMKETSTGNFVFSHFDGGSCRLHLLDMLKKVQVMAGIRGNLRVHDLRHTLAVRLRQAGVRLETIMGVMRHADIRETLIYAPYSLTEGHTAISVLDKPKTPGKATLPAENPENRELGSVPEHESRDRRA